VPLRTPTCPPGRTGTILIDVSEKPVALDLDDSGLARGLPRPVGQDEIQGVPYRPVGFRDDDLPTALGRAAQWLREVQDWLGEPVDVIGVHLDYDDTPGGIYYEVKLLCNDEDLAGVPIALRAQRRDEERGEAVGVEGG